MRAIVDLASVVANWKTFQRLAGTAETAAVVKADAYGLGAAAVAPALAKAGARTFFTATVQEALTVRRALGPEPTIVALNGVMTQDAARASAAAITPTINSLDQARQWAGSNDAAPFLHIDTGMSRLGLRPEETGPAKDLLGGTAPALVMSHLACASTPAHPLNAKQRETFLAAALAFPGARLSLAASAGSQLGPAYTLDMIRPGIGLYGWDGMDEETTPLSAAVTVTAPVLQTRTVHAGETCGYGATFTAPHALTAAIIACGYADGYLRAGSSHAHVGYQGQRLPVLGRVSMDLLIVDASAAPSLAAGASVELVGQTITAAAAAAASGTLPYELFTTFVGRSPRTYRPPQ